MDARDTANGISSRRRSVIKYTLAVSVAITLCMLYVSYRLRPAVFASFSSGNIPEIGRANTKNLSQSEASCEDARCHTGSLRNLSHCTSKTLLDKDCQTSWEGQFVLRNLDLQQIHQKAVEGVSGDCFRIFNGSVDMIAI